MTTATRVLTEPTLFPHSICVSSRPQQPSRRQGRKAVSRIYDEYALDHFEDEEDLDEVLDLIESDEENL